MFAYVKFLNGPQKDKKIITSIKFLQNFKIETHKSVIKYIFLKPGENKNKTVVILKLESSKKDLIAKLEEGKRLTNKPQHLLQTASEEDERNNDADQQHHQRSKSVAKRKVTKCLVEIPKLKSDLISTSNYVKENADVKNIIKKKLDSFRNPNDNVVVTSNSRQPLQDNNSNNKKDEATNDILIKKLPSTKDENYIKGRKNDSIENELYVTECQKPNVICNSQEIESSIKITDKDYADGHQLKNLNKITIKNVMRTVQMSKEIDSLKIKNSKLLVERDNLKKEIVSLKRDKDRYKNKYTEESVTCRELRNLNINIQKAFIEKIELREDMLQKMLSQKFVNLSQNYPAIGKLITNKENMKVVHIGNDTWIPEKDYITFLNHSKSPRACAGNILTLVFDLRELMSSTKTGFQARKKNEPKKSCNKLDEVKYNTCEEFYHHWMTNIYNPNEKQKEVYDADFCKFDVYACKKIADLKRPSISRVVSKKRATKRLRKTSTDESHESELESNEKNQKEEGGHRIKNEEHNSISKISLLEAEKDPLDTSEFVSVETVAVDHFDDEPITADIEDHEYMDYSPAISTSFSESEKEA